MLEVGKNSIAFGLYGFRYPYLNGLNSDLFVRGSTFCFNSLITPFVLRLAGPIHASSTCSTTDFISVSVLVSFFSSVISNKSWFTIVTLYCPVWCLLARLTMAWTVCLTSVGLNFYNILVKLRGLIEPKLPTTNYEEPIVLFSNEFQIQKNMICRQSWIYFPVGGEKETLTINLLSC
ncbi:hypothetical protein AGLY_015163 [Aphis glycines]|uniref:Uncharacterized protein n=1 Tax=Aphis glycines TaxID=307491 RepID=A0A6G0T1R1_APHGL|nr:hypothetical protein AGLY_015163 [Aphis glycines]